jgi:diguanylate cyclase (GGDEF)-like protein
VARLGGDEFIITLWHVSGTDYAATVALRAIEAVSQPYDIEGSTVSITTSVGVSVYPIHGEDAETLMKSADLALYEAKRTGKNTYRISERTGMPAAEESQPEPPAFNNPLPDASEKTKDGQ